MSDTVKIKKFIEDDSRNFYEVNQRCHKWWVGNKNNIKILSAIYGVTPMSEIDPTKGTDEYRRHLLIRYTGNAIDIVDEDEDDENIDGLKEQLQNIEKRLNGIEYDLEGFVEISKDEMETIWGKKK